MLAVLGRSWALMGGLEPLLGPLCPVSIALGGYVGGLGPLGPYVAGLGPLLGLCWRSWAALGAYVGGIEPKNVKNMATLKMCLVLERERDLSPRGQSGAALGSCLGSLGPLLGSCWRSWAALGANLRDLGA